MAISTSFLSVRIDALSQNSTAGGALRQFLSETRGGRSDTAWRLWPRLRALTVGDVIDALDARWPGCSTVSVFGTRRQSNVFVDARRATLETRLASGAEVAILTGTGGA
jgi:hypothetical protein